MNGTRREFSIPVTRFAAIFLACCHAAAAQTSPPAQGDSSLAAFKNTMENRLHEERTRIRNIAEPVLERFKRMRGDVIETDIQTQAINVQHAEAAHQNARLTREVSQIFVKEYEEGIYLQDQAAAEGEVRRAEAAIKRSMDGVVDASALLEKVKKIATVTVYDTWVVVQFEDRLKLEQSLRRKAELELEMAKSKLEILNKYTKFSRLQQLRSDVEKARSEELSKEMTVQLEKSKLARIKKQAEGIKPPAKYQPILSLLEEAARLDGELRGKLVKLGPKDDAPGSASRKEIEELGRSLEAKVNEAGRLFEDVKFSELASDIRFAAGRPTSDTGLFAPGNSGNLLSRFRNISADERAGLKTATEEERTRIYQKAGFTATEIQELQYRRERIERGETGP